MSATATISGRRPGLLSPGVIVAVIAAIALVAFGLAARAAGPAGAGPLRLVSMAEGAQAMARAGETMQTHGRAMLDEGRRRGDQELIAHGEHWQRDGQALAHGGRWMAMDPTAPTSLATTPAALAAQGSWGELVRTAQAMQHDPAQARVADPTALRWAGLAMRAEGRAMAEHGQVMAEEAELMVARHGLSGQTADELRTVARTMRTAGEALGGNGQAMIDYAEGLRRSLGKR